MLSQPKRGVQGKLVGLLFVMMCLAFWTLSLAQPAPTVQSSPATQELTPAAYLPMIIRGMLSPTIAASR